MSVLPNERNSMLCSSFVYFSTLYEENGCINRYPSIDATVFYKVNQIEHRKQSDNQPRNHRILFNQFVDGEGFDDKCRYFPDGSWQLKKSSVRRCLSHLKT